MDKDKAEQLVLPAGRAVLVGLLHPHVDVIDVEEVELPAVRQPQQLKQNTAGRQQPATHQHF